VSTHINVQSLLRTKSTHNTFLYCWQEAVGFEKKSGCKVTIYYSADINTYKNSIAIKHPPSPKILLGLGLISSRIPLFRQEIGGN